MKSARVSQSSFGKLRQGSPTFCEKDLAAQLAREAAGEGGRDTVRRWAAATAELTEQAILRPRMTAKELRRRLEPLNDACLELIIAFRTFERQAAQRRIAERLVAEAICDEVYLWADMKDLVDTSDLKQPRRVEPEEYVRTRIDAVKQLHLLVMRAMGRVPVKSGRGGAGNTGDQVKAELADLFAIVWWKYFKTVPRLTASGAAVQALATCFTAAGLGDSGAQHHLRKAVKSYATLLRQKEKKST